MNELVVRVSAAFWDDHYSRDLDFTSEEIARNKLTVTLKMSQQAVNELASDADYYASFDGEDLRDNLATVRAARSTLQALQRQGLI
jgi:ribonuclease PH